MFDVDEEITEGYRKLAIEGYNKLDNLVNAFFASEKARVLSKLPLISLLQKLSILSLRMSEYYLNDDAGINKKEVKALASEIQVNMLVLMKKLKVNIEDVILTTIKQKVF